MEKTLKMSVETARQIYKDYNFCMEIKAEITLALSSMYKMVMENFTKEELEPKKGFTWEESVNNNDGFYIEWDKISNGKASPLRPLSKCLFKTEKQALSALAFAQLTHICAKYNENTIQDKKYTYYTIIKLSPGFVGLQVSEVNYMSGTHLYFNRIEDARTSLNVNYGLWHQYWGVD